MMVPSRFGVNLSPTRLVRRSIPPPSVWSIHCLWWSSRDINAKNARFSSLLTVSSSHRSHDQRSNQWNSTATRNFGGSPHKVDTLIIGGGPVGGSTAYHLAKKRITHSEQDATVGSTSILVVERDPTYNSGSAVYSAGGIRLQFSLKENVQMSLYGINFLRQASSNFSTTSTDSTSNLGSRSDDEKTIDIQYVENGYLFLASSDDSAQQLRHNHELYKQLGCGDMIDLLQPNEVISRFPWINVHDVTLASHGVSGEGWFDPWTFINAMKEKNKEMGVKYMHGSLVGASRDETGKVVSVDIQQNWSSSLSSSSWCSSQVETIQVGQVVNAAGAAADVVLDTLAGNDRPLEHKLPVRPRKRSIYFFHSSADQIEQQDSSNDEVPSVAPLTIDSSGVYFRSEGIVPGTGNFLCGVSPLSQEDYDCYDQENDLLRTADPYLFDERIWPALYNRVPAFGCIKVKSSWAGLYEYNTLDQNCIIDYHPEMSNVLMINGFSGHGLQHSPAAGRAASELIDDENTFQSLDLDVFRFDRVIQNRPVFERGIY